MLRKLRIGLAAVFFIGITLLFIGIGEQWWGWMAKLQFLPSCLAANFIVILAILVLTLVFGRIYCSVICPLGIFQDIVIALKKRICKKSAKYSFRKENKLLRYGVMLLFMSCIFADIQLVVTLLAPYGAYGRMVSSIVHPHGWIVPVVAGLTFIVVVLMAWMGGRAWCNQICPVGSALSLFSRFSLFGIRIDEDKCKACRLCERSCKASCIDVEHRSVDRSRCVDCFDCIGSCHRGGVTYGIVRRKSKTGDAPDAGRRAFMGAAVMIGASAALNAQNKLDGGLAPVVPKQTPGREHRLTPAGSVSAKKFYERCTACQLCVSNCPNKVLRPSTDLEHLMQPCMGFEQGFCRPECTICSSLCPAGAIGRISPEEKTAIHIGRAVVNLDNCLSASGKENCRSCGSHCPAGAISYVNRDPEDSKSPRMPVVREDLCIGCGKCEFLCPVRPVSAIHVEGYPDHIIS